MLSPLDRARDAFDAAEWERAKEAFEEALAIDETAEARDGLGYSIWWLGDIVGGMRERERAYVAFLERGQPQRAAEIAVWIAVEHSAGFGNHAASAGWLGRAARLLAGEPSCRASATLLLTQSRRIVDPIAATEGIACAMDMARQVGARDAEVLALACLGRIDVQAGRVEEGFARLDEAMVAATSGEMRNHHVVADTFCVMLTSCDRVQDWARAAEWCRVTEEFARRSRCLPILAFCRVMYGNVLVAQGRWGDAEDEFVDALARWETHFPGAAVGAAVKLADLRLAQGRLADAESLVAKWVEHPAATGVVARLSATRGELEHAVTRLERRISVLEGDAPLVAPLLDVLARVHVARGDLAAARASADRLVEIASHHGGAGLRALADALVGELMSAAGDQSAVAKLDAALDTYAKLEMPYYAARVRLALARALAARCPDAAAAQARAALATFEDLGAGPKAEEAAELLRVVGGARVTPRRVVDPDMLTKREAEVLSLLGEGLSNPAIAERLDISPKTAEHHVGSILAKLNVKTRAAAAAWAARREKREVT